MPKANLILDSQPKFILLDKLPGWLGKRIKVPQGMECLVIEPDGQVITYDPGQRTILNPFERLTGKGIGAEILLVPSGDFNLYAHYSEIQCGDHAYVDVKIKFIVQIMEKGLFVQSLKPTIQKIEILPDFLFSNSSLKIGEIISHYERKDLLLNIPVAQLSDEIVQALSSDFLASGLLVKGVALLVIQKSEDVLSQEQNFSDSQTRFDIQNPELITKKSSSDQIVPESTPSIFEGAIYQFGEKKAFSEVITDIQRFHEVERKNSNHNLINSLRMPRENLPNANTREGLRKWSLLEITWVVLLIFIGAFVTFILEHLNLKTSETVTFLLGIWGTIITLILKTLEKVIKRQESMINRSKNLEELDDARLISLDDRTQVDELVREKCVSEIQRSITLVKQCRSTVYQNQKMDLALELKNLEEYLEINLKKFLNRTYGRAYYIEDIEISNRDWKKILDEDELVLKTAKLLTEMAELMNYAADRLNSEDINKFKQQFLLLDGVFFNRSRIN